MFLMMTILVHGEKVAVIDEVLKPASIAIDGSQLYVTEGATIFIYSLKDYSFVKKFGRAGQGPQEFPLVPGLPLTIDVSKKNIFVSCLAKVLYFKKDGSYIREIKSKGLGWIFSPLKDGYVGYGRTVEEEIAYDIINFYDAELNRGKEIARSKLAKRGGNIEVLKRTFSFQINEEKIFITKEEGFVIDVFDHTGEKLYSITREYKKIKFDPEVEKLLRDNIKKRNPAQYEAIKNILEFPEYFPAILNFFIDDNKIYAATWNLQKDKVEFFIFDLKGNLLKQKFIAIKFQEDSITPFPVTVKNGKLYQLIENEDEEWELHVTKFD